MADSNRVTVTDLRCDVHPARLFARLRQEGEHPAVLPDLNLVEFACRDCRNRYKREGKDVAQVLHRYNLAGELVETVYVETSDSPTRADSIEASNTDRPQGTGGK